MRRNGRSSGVLGRGRDGRVGRGDSRVRRPPGSIPASRPRRSRSAARSRSRASPSLYKTIPAAESAYFAYVNDHGGVNGRKIDFTVLDDAYDPSKTVPLTQQLVEQNKVFAVFGSLGTAPNLAIWSYLNKNKVPQVCIATGDSYWGFSAKKYPWTIGYQPDYPGEGKIYGKYIAANMPSREDRRPLPERRVRQELLRRASRRPGREEEPRSSRRSRTT